MVTGRPDEIRSGQDPVSSVRSGRGLHGRPSLSFVFICRSDSSSRSRSS